MNKTDEIIEQAFSYEDAIRQLRIYRIKLLNKKSLNKNLNLDSEIKETSNKINGLRDSVSHF